MIPRASEIARHENIEAMEVSVKGTPGFPAATKAQLGVSDGERSLQRETYLARVDYRATEWRTPQVTVQLADRTAYSKGSRGGIDSRHLVIAYTEKGESLAESTWQTFDSACSIPGTAK
jgi:hypothetical protein